MAVNRFTAVKIVRPALRHVEIQTGLPESFARDWQWVRLDELAETAGIPAHHLLLEFADSKFRSGKCVGICILWGSTDSGYTMLVVKQLEMIFDRARACGRDRDDGFLPEDFFWLRKDIELPPNSFYRSKTHNVFFAERPDQVLVPSGWANSILDEIERRHEAGEPIIQSVNK